MGFLNLKPRYETSRKANLMFATLMMNHVVITTTMLGKQYDPNWNVVTTDEDFTFAASLLARHIEIVMPNRSDMN